LDQFHHPTKVFTSMNLRSHLSLHPRFGSSLGNDPAFMNITGKGFLAVDMLFLPVKPAKWQRHEYAQLLK